MVIGPVVGRRAVAADLRRFRSESGRTIEDVASHLECSPAKVSRMETGAVKVGVQDLRALLELYGVTGTVRDEMFALVRQSRRRGWWADYSDVVPSGSARFYGLEDGAGAIGQHSSSLVPGLLQTREYAAALIGSVPGIEPELVQRRVDLRMRRQQLLDRPDPPRLRVLLDEAVLHRRIGGPVVMAAQLRYLLSVAQRPDVQLQVIEFAAEVHPAVGVSFTVFEFDPGPGDLEGADAVVFREQLDANSFLERPEDVAVYAAALDAAARVAADQRRTHELLQAQLDRL